jgi:CBS domain-containing protein
VKASELMVSPVHVVSESATLREAATLMVEKGIGCLPVVDADGRLVGILTEGDFAAKEHGVPFSTFRAPKVFRHWLGPEGVDKLYAAAREAPVSDFMTRRVATVTEDATVADVVRLMMARRIRRVPVLRDGKPVGLVAQHDLVRLAIAEVAGIHREG